MLSNLIVVSGMAFLSIGYFFTTKESYYKKLFQRIQKCQKYHLDYVEKVDQLPLSQEVILFGTAKSNSSESIIAKSYIVPSQENDRLWNFNLKNAFNLTTSGKESIQVIPSPQTPILAFNLHKINEANHLEERVIYHNEPVCVFGKLLNEGAVKKIAPELIMGTKHEQILIYLDKEIIKYSQKVKVLSGLGTAILLLHFGYQLIFQKKVEKTRSVEFANEVVEVRKSDIK